MVANIVSPILNVPSCPQVERELQFLKRTSFRFWYEEIDQEERDYIETGKYAQAARRPNLVHEHWKDKNKDSSTQQVDRYRNSHTGFAGNEGEDFCRYREWRGSLKQKNGVSLYV